MDKNKLKNLIDVSKTAIAQTGKSFNSIPKDSIIDFLQRRGLNTANSQFVYDQLVLEYNKPTSSWNVKDERASQGSQGSQGSQTPQIQKDAPKREPRKSIFGSITKIH